MEVAQDGTKEIAAALTLIAEERDGGLVFHCASGKDRTGQLAAWSSPCSASPTR